MHIENEDDQLFVRDFMRRGAALSRGADTGA